MKTKELLEKLTLIKTALATSGADDTAKSFLFSDNKLYAYSDRLFASTPIDIGIEAQVDGKTLFEYIKKIKNEDVELSVVNNQLRIKAGMMKGKIACEEQVLIPNNLVELAETIELPANFSEAVVAASFSVSKDPSKDYLNCVKVSGDKVESTDNRSITRAIMNGEIDGTLFIPGYALKHIKPVSPTSYSVCGGWLAFVNDETSLVFCCRTLDSNKFPDLDSVFNRKMTYEEVVFPRETVDAIERALVFTKSNAANARSVKFTSDGNCLLIGGKSKTGDHSEKLEGKMCEFSFVVGAKVLIDAIKKKPKIGISGNIMKIEKDDVINLICLGK